MLCKKCKGATSVYRTKTSAKVDIRDRRCSRCGEGWETNEREVPGTRYTFAAPSSSAAQAPPECHGGATNSTPVAPGQQAGSAPMAPGGRGALPPDHSSTSRSRSDSDSGPGLADLPARTRVEPIAPDQRRWPAEEWFQGFRIAWITYAGSASYGGRPNDWRAVGEMRAILEKLSLEDALGAQGRAQGIFGAFFTDPSPDLVSAGYPWSWFVQRFDGLRLPRAARRPANRAEGTVTNMASWLGKKVDVDS